MRCYKNLLSLNVYYVHDCVGIHAQKCLPEFVWGAGTALAVDGTEITWEVKTGACAVHTTNGTTEVTGTDDTVVVVTADDVTNKSDKY